MQKECLRIIDGRDRAQLFVDGQWIATQYQTEIGEDIYLSGQSERLSEVDILIENIEACRYGRQVLTANAQRKDFEQVSTGSFLTGGNNIHCHWIS